MRYPRSTITVIAVLVVALTGAMLLPYESREESREESEARREDRAQHGRTVVLTPEVQTQIGVRTESLVTGDVPLESRAFGRVVDPTPLAEAAAALAAARASSEAAERSLARSRGLFERDASVSQRTVEGLAADAVRARGELDVARAHLVGPWGSEIAGRGDLEAFVRSLVDGDARLVKLDLTGGERLDAAPRRARIEPTLASAVVLDAAFVGEAGAVDAVDQGRSYFFIVESPPPELPPGAAVVGYLRTAGAPESGVLLPRAAVVRAEGRSWVYVKGGNGTFERRLVDTDRATASGWLERRRLAAGDQVVVVGAQELLSAEHTDLLGAAAD